MYQAEERLKELFDEREQQNQFDLGWLESLTEKPLLQITGYYLFWLKLFIKEELYLN